MLAFQNLCPDYGAKSGAKGNGHSDKAGEAIARRKAMNSVYAKASGKSLLYPEQLIGLFTSRKCVRHITSPRQKTLSPGKGFFGINGELGVINAQG